MLRTPCAWDFSKKGPVHSAVNQVPKSGTEFSSELGKAKAVRKRSLSNTVAGASWLCNSHNPTQLLAEGKHLPFFFSEHF